MRAIDRFRTSRQGSTDGRDAGFAHSGDAGDLRKLAYAFAKNETLPIARNAVRKRNLQGNDRAFRNSLGGDSAARVTRLNVT